MSSLQILISGAGIAGPAVAFWLSRQGHSCTIVERCSKFRGEGQQVDLRGHGITVVERMGLKEEMLKHNVDEMGLRIVNVRGETQMLVPRQEQGEKTKVFTSEMEIMRTDLCRILYEATKGKVAYRFGVTVEDYDNEGDGVRVRLSDSGTTERFDLLIAADGGHSRIREMMLRKDGSIRDSSVPLGVFVAYFKLARRADDENMATGCCATKQRRMMTRWHRGDVGQAYLMTKSGGATIRASLEKGGSGVKEGQGRQKEAFAGVFEGAGWQAERIVEAMRGADDFYAEEIVQRRSSGWHSGRVVLLGDACYAPGAVTGMGTTLALVGAYVLAGELVGNFAEGKLGEAFTGGKSRGVEAGLEAYERRMRPYVEAGHAVPLGMWSPTWARTAAGVRIVMVVLKMAMWMRVGRVMAWVESKRRWEMPDYRELSDKMDKCEEE